MLKAGPGWSAAISSEDDGGLSYQRWAVLRWGRGFGANRLGSIPVKVGLEEMTQKSESGGFRGVCSELGN